MSLQQDDISNLCPFDDFDDRCDGNMMKKMKTPALYNDSAPIWRISNLRPSPFFLLESRFFMRSLSKSSRTKITSFPELSSQRNYNNNNNNNNTITQQHNNNSNNNKVLKVMISSYNTAVHYKDIYLFALKANK